MMKRSIGPLLGAGATLAATTLLSLAAAAQLLSHEGPSKFTYQGRITHANGTAVEDPSVSFTLQVRSPDGACLLYEETHVRNMTNTNGVFSVFVGAGTNSGASPLSIKQAFDNNAAKLGATGCAYVPVAGDARKLRFTFDTGSELVTLPQDQTILSVPYAMNANSIQGLGPADLVKTGGTTTQVNIDLLMAQTTQLLALANGSSTTYANGASFPTTGLTQGQVLSWDATLNKWVGLSQAALIESGVPSLSSPGKVSGDTIINGTIGGTTIINTSGTVTSSAVSTTTVSTQNIRLFDSTNSKKISVVAPLGLSSDYTLTLPGNAGANGYMLMTDGTGALSWSKLTLNNLKSSVAGNLFSNPSCAANETLTWSAMTDQFSCVAIGSLSASSITSGTLSPLRGGTGQSTYANGELLIGNASGGLSRATLSAGSGISIANGNGTIAISTSGFANISNLRSSGGLLQIPTNCTAAQTLVYQSMIDTFVCTNITVSAVTSVAAGNGLLGGPITSTGTLSVDTGTTANKIVQLDSQGKLPALDASQLTNLPVPSNFAPFSNAQMFDSSSTFTVPAGVTRVFVQSWGGGGGGGCGASLLGIGWGGSGGGGGGYGAGYATVTPGATVSVTVGSAGTACLSSSTVAVAGGTSSFGSLVSASGGVGGASGSAQPVAGGTSSATLNTAGGKGGPANSVGGGTGGTAANGGGAGGAESVNNSYTGWDGVAPGGGGGGGSSATNGGHGAKGRVIVWF